MRRFLPLIGGVLIGGGIFFLGWYVWVLVEPAKAPYSYRLITKGQSGDFPDLGIQLSDEILVEKYGLHVPEVDETVVDLYVARNGDTVPVLLDWRNRFSDPVFRLTTDAAETRELVRAVVKNLSPESLVLAWWDTSRLLRLAAGVSVSFDSFITDPLFVPEPWRGKEDAIRVAERRFWQAGSNNNAENRFHLYLDALASDLPEGLVQLRKLAGEGEVYLVVHLRDAYRLGALRPKAFGVGYKDFPWTGNTHGMISGVKSWLQSKGYDAYSAERTGQDVTRVYFLTDTDSSQRLLARLLPFSTSKPTEIGDLQLVFQHGGYWVYRLPAENEG